MIQYRTGNLLDSKMQTLVNTVNLVGVMGKGIALAFKQRYPAMFEEYKIKCETKELEIGKLHLYKADDHWILNFPTKRHYRMGSRLTDIKLGLGRLRDTYAEMGIESLAVPALGCGHGGLDWAEVRPQIERYLGDLPIPVEVYPPQGEALPEGQPGQAADLPTGDALQLILLDVEIDKRPAKSRSKPKARPKKSTRSGK